MTARNRIGAGVAFVALVLSALSGLAGGDEQKRTPEAPPNARAVAGVFYRGDGLDYNITLTLEGFLRAARRHSLLMLSKARESQIAQAAEATA